VTWELDGLQVGQKHVRLYGADGSSWVLIGVFDFPFTGWGDGLFLPELVVLLDVVEAHILVTLLCLWMDGKRK